MITEVKETMTDENGAPLKPGSMFDGLDERTLINIASNEYGLAIDPSVPKDAIVSELVRQHEARNGAAKTLNAETANMVATEDDPIVPISFARFDFASADLKFCYDSGRGYIGSVRDGRTRAAKEKRGMLPRPAWYHLFPGNKYELPMSVVRFLQSKVMIDNQPVIDPVTGMISGNRPVLKPRFSINIVMSDSQLKKIGKTKI